MNIQINVSGTIDSMTQADSQRVKRCSNMLTEAGFHVEIVWDADMDKTSHQRTHPIRTVLTHY
jgi:G:T-mismatch repair DNA endonuclease (very short patch repair protein)